MDAGVGSGSWWLAGFEFARQEVNVFAVVWLGSLVGVLGSEICAIWISKSKIIAKKKRWVIDSRFSPPTVFDIYKSFWYL